MKLSFTLIFAAFLLIFLGYATQQIHAGSSDIKINEFAAVTSGTKADPDWVEIYNASDSIVALEGWLLKDSKETNKVLLSGCISPKKFRKFDFFNRLDKSGDQIRIFDKNGNVVDSIEYFSESTIPIIPAHQKGQSTGRNPNGSDTWGLLTTPTPTNSTCTSRDNQTSNKLFKLSLSEIFPNPEKGGREWVEIYNPNSSKVSLANWKLTDNANHNKQLSGSVSARTYKVFEFSSGWLNNSGDSVSLISPAGSKLETYKYPKSTKGSSFAKDTNGKWKATTTPTPGKPNKITGESLLADFQNSSAAESSTSDFGSAGFESTIDYLTDTFQIETPESTQEAPTEGKVAGVSERKNQPKSLATLLIAAGVAFIGTAIVWPILEKRKLL